LNLWFTRKARRKPNTGASAGVVRRVTLQLPNNLRYAVFVTK
jgi:hypothetical protein